MINRSEICFQFQLALQLLERKLSYLQTRGLGRFNVGRVRVLNEPLPEHALLLLPLEQAVVLQTTQRTHLDLVLQPRPIPRVLWIRLQTGPDQRSLPRHGADS